MGQLSHDGVLDRLSMLADVLTHLEKGQKLLREYENNWGTEGFIHSILELVSAAQLTLETSMAILHDYIGDTKGRIVPGEENDPNGNR